MRAIIASVAVVLSTISLLVGCASAAGANPEKLVPADSNLIAKIQLAQILKDVDFEALYREAPKEADDPQSFAELLDRAQEETGIDFRQFSTVVLFSDVSRIEEQDYFGVIAEGRFEEEKLLEAIKKDGETSLTTTEYQGQKIHLDPEDGVALSVFGRDTLVLGSEEAVRAVTDVRKGGKALSSGRVYDTFKAQGDPLVRLVMEVPAKAKEGLARKLGQLPGGSIGRDNPPLALPGLQGLDMIGFVMDKNQEILTARAQLDFSSEQSADNVGDAIEGFLKLFGSLSPDQEARRVLDRVQVSVAGPRLTILLEAPVSELKGSIGGLEVGLAGPSMPFGIDPR